MWVDGERVDSVSLRVAARSERKSVGRLLRLVRASLALVWSASRRRFLSLMVLQLVAAATPRPQSTANRMIEKDRIIRVSSGGQDWSIDETVTIRP